MDVESGGQENTKSNQTLKVYGKLAQFVAGLGGLVGGITLLAFGMQDKEAGKIAGGAVLTTAGTGAFVEACSRAIFR